jgi:hypothetical protein
MKAEGLSQGRETDIVLQPTASAIGFAPRAIIPPAPQERQGNG